MRGPADLHGRAVRRLNLGPVRVAPAGDRALRATSGATIHR